jgi:hypothetical protein
LSFRFRKLKEEESRRKVFLEKAEQTEQAGTQAGIVDGKQNSDASGDNIDEQESHENEPIIANGNGGLSHSTNEMIPNGSMKEVCFVLIKATNIFK